MKISPATRIYLPDEVHSKHGIIAKLPLEFFQIIQGFQSNVVNIICNNMEAFREQTNLAFQRESHGNLEIKKMKWGKYGITSFGIGGSPSEESMTYIPYQDVDFIDNLLADKDNIVDDAKGLTFDFHSGNIQDIQTAFMLESVVNKYIHEILDGYEMQNFKL